MTGEPADFGSRLEPSTVAALLAVGWHPGRRVDVSAAVQALEAQGYTKSPVIVDFLESFGGLKIGPAREDGPNFSNGEPFLVDPVGVGRHQDEAEAIGAAIGGSWFPVGWWLSYSHVFMDQEGALSACANELIWSLGSNPCEGLDLMVSANRPLVCVYAPKGRKPWPR